MYVPPDPPKAIVFAGGGRLTDQPLRFHECSLGFEAAVRCTREPHPSARRAKEQLGPKFDLKSFHDEILSGGALPLDALDARIDRWIKAQLS